MTDFEREIEIRLDKFQALTGKGNVKDSNRTLYEIVRLMLGMINQREPRHAFNMHKHPPTKAAEPGEPIHEALHPTSEQTPPASLLDPVKDAVAATLARQEHEAPSPPASPPLSATGLDITPIVIPGKDGRRPINAPLGFTAAGNVRRASRHKPRQRKEG